MRIGVDLGGTKIEIAVLDDGGHMLLRRRVPSPAHDYRAIVDSIATLVHDAETELGRRCSIGVGTPGSISPTTGLIRNANSTSLIGNPFKDDLETRLGRSVRMENDANCLALSEAVDGAGAGAVAVFGVILGTGVGGGIALNGRPLSGRNGIAGEWGHTPLPWARDDERPGPLCYCGKYGCIETFLSGPGLARDYGGRDAGRDAQAVVRAAARGDARASETLERYVDRLARGLAVIINVLDPDVIVLGGGVSNVDLLYDEVPARLPQYVFSDAVTTPLRPAQHGDSSGVRGAAWLWPEPEPA